MSGDLDLPAISRWMADRGLDPGGGLVATKFTGGQSNPTYRLTSPAGTVVLRRKPFGNLLPSAHAIDREFRVQRALAETSVPVPRMLALCETGDVTGAMFYLMEDVPGRVFDDPRLPDLDRPARAVLYDEMNRVLAAIHAVDLAATGLAGFGASGDYFARQIGRWSQQYRASETETVPAMDRLIDWLDAHRPPDDGRRTLVHGDYRIDNLIFAGDAPRCAAVLDWELSTLGHPFADLAALLMQWRMPPGPEGRGLAGIDRAAEGLPSDAAFLADYARRMGIDAMPPIGFYLAFAFFRMAAILQGVKKRALDGTASDPERGLRLGAQVPRFAEEGLAAAGA